MKSTQIYHVNFRGFPSFKGPKYMDYMGYSETGVKKKVREDAEFWDALEYWIVGTRPRKEIGHWINNGYRWVKQRK